MRKEKTGKVGFEWDKTEEVWEKVLEEIGGLKEEVESGNKVEMEEEFGDTLFALVNYARFIDVDPETALAKCNQKFKKRFQYIEENADDPLENMSLEDMDAMWNDAKSTFSKKL